MIYDRSHLHTSLFITVNVPLYTARDFSGVTWNWLICFFTESWITARWTRQNSNFKIRQADSWKLKISSSDWARSAFLKDAPHSSCQEEVQCHRQATHLWQAPLPSAELKSPEDGFKLDNSDNLQLCKVNSNSTAPWKCCGLECYQNTVTSIPNRAAGQSPEASMRYLYEVQTTQSKLWLVLHFIGWSIFFIMNKE